MEILPQENAYLTSREYDYALLSMDAIPYIIIISTGSNISEC